MSTAALQRRLKQRRQMLVLQATAYTLGDIILWDYAYAGTIPVLYPSLFFLFSMALTALFAVLSELGVGERFDDHFLTTPQAGSAIVVQLGFLLAAPEIGFWFLTVVFVIFSFAAMRITSRQAVFLWATTAVSVGVIFALLKIPIALPMSTIWEWLAGTCIVALTVGKSAYIGHFGYAMRSKLQQRTIELQAANKRIEELAQLDELTGLLNRRYVLRALDEEMARAQRTGIPCAVAIIDLDYFKKINDQFGHPAGDEVLRTFGITLFANIRTVDKLGRYGGEEFLLVLPDTTKVQAVHAIDRLRLIVSGLDWTAISNDMTLTMSVGVCTIRENDSPDDVLARADIALYRSKDAGRDQVTAA
jgi:diguanylate cyclase